MQQWQGLTSPQGKICLKKLHWDCRVDGYICRLKAEQHYVNQLDEPVESVYTFSIPHDAAVTSFAMTDAKGARTVAKPSPRLKAQKIYEEALESGKAPALLEMSSITGMSSAIIDSISGRIPSDS